MKTAPDLRETPRPCGCRLRAGAVACAVLWLLAGPANVSAAAPRIQVENLRVGFGPSNSFKVGTWTPVWVQLRAGEARFVGFMDVVAADDDGTPTAFRLPVDVGPRSSQQLTAYVRPGSRDPELAIRLLDPEGRRVASVTQDVVMPQPPIPLMPDETLVLTMGQPQGVETILELPGFLPGGRATPFSRRSGDPIVAVRIDTQAGRLPGRWYGFDAASVVILDTSDRAALASLDALRGQALVEWVKRGGHLVVAVGANWQIVRDSILGPILPGLPSGLERVPSLEVLETFAGATKPITPPDDRRPPVMVTKLEEIGARGGTVLSPMSNLALVVRGPYGFGRVTLIALDVDQKLLSDWPDRGLFWARAIDLRRHRADPVVSGPQLGGGTRFNRSGISDLAGQLRVALEQFPGVRLIPFGWVAFFIFLYILLIGPGDYFFLKKVLKRMELTWITFPTIVVTVSLVAYYSAYLLKGNDLLVNKVDVVDIDQANGLLRGSTWVSLFSPQNRDYTLRTVPHPLDRDPPQAAAGHSSESPRAPAGTDVVMSWFSAPENQFGSMGSSSRRFSFASSGYAYQPTAGVEYLENVRVPIWSTKCITARWFGPAGPLIAADLEPMGTDRLAGTVVNQLDVPLEDAIVAFGKQVYLLGTLAPGAALRVELLQNDRSLSGYLKSKHSTYLTDPNGSHEARINRADLMLTAMFHDSESTLATERVLSNDPLRDLDLTGQLALKRPMLVARIGRPGARLVIENAPSSPKVDQTTLVRIILPLKKAKPAS
jgi:hypothetical protein